MKKTRKSSEYFLTKDKKLEIHEGGHVFRSKVPLRFYLNPWEFVQNIFFGIIKSKKKLREYTIKDLKDLQTKTIYLKHSEIQQVWNHPVKEKVQASPKKTTVKPKLKKKVGA